ncbi:ABC transporter permease [Streptomyces sp. NPDC051597]|uniref:ABC transporter permease n=1 Tax=Streptomyces sp. NPDC051597 TaxID=3155049 RepID=UPI00342CF466
MGTWQAAELTAVLSAAGASVEPEGSAGAEKLAVTGLSSDRIAALAFENGILLNELKTRAASLEDASMELTADSIEYMTLMLVAGSMGALTVISEHSSGLIRTTLAAVPARSAVVLAKAVVTALLWTAVGTAAAIGSFLVSQAILDGHGAAVPITHPDVLRPLVPSALLAPVCAVTGLGLAVLRRHAAATLLTSAFTLLMLPTMFSESNRWSADIKHTTVSAAWTRLVQTWKLDPGTLGYTATLPGSWIVYALWPLTAVALAVAVVRHRDV